MSRKFRESGLLSTADIAKQTGMDRTTVWLWVQADAFPVEKIGAFIGVKQEDLDAFLKTYSVSPRVKKKRPSARKRVSPRARPASKKKTAKKSSVKRRANGAKRGK